MIQPRAECGATSPLVRPRRDPTAMETFKSTLTSFGRVARQAALSSRRQAAERVVVTESCCPERTEHGGRGRAGQGRPPGSGPSHWHPTHVRPSGHVDAPAAPAAPAAATPPPVFAPHVSRPALRARPAPSGNCSYRIELWIRTQDKGVQSTIRRRMEETLTEGTGSSRFSGLNGVVWKNHRV